MDNIELIKMNNNKYNDCLARKNIISQSIDTELNQKVMLSLIINNGDDDNFFFWFEGKNKSKLVMIKAKKNKLLSKMIKTCTS